MISFSAVFVRLTTMTPTVDAFYRMFFGGLILLIIAIYKKQQLFTSRSGFFWACMAGLLFATDLTFWHRSIDKLGPGLATIIVNMQVFVFAISSILISKQRPSNKFIMALLFAALGMYLLVGYEWSVVSSEYKFGIVQCLIAMLAYTAYILCFAPVTKQPQTCETYCEFKRNLSVQRFGISNNCQQFARNFYVP